MPPRTAVSVIVPTYNRAATLAQSLESILGQTFSDFELVVAVDESLRLLSDLDFVLRFALRWPIAFVDVPVFAYHQRADSLTADRRAVREQSLVILERFVDGHPDAITRLGERRIRRKRAH